MQKGKEWVYVRVKENKEWGWDRNLGERAESGGRRDGQGGTSGVQRKRDFGGVWGRRGLGEGEGIFLPRLTFV